MKFNVIPTENFKRAAKRLILKFPSLKDELKELSVMLSVEPETGVSLGFNVYKIRLSIKSKGKGKRGGGRVITYIVSSKNEIYLLAIYDKSEFDTIDNKRLKTIIKGLLPGK
ncbi:MAG: hypothetical protein ABI851_16690 [Saprospiraceae bacterium]